MGPIASQWGVYSWPTLYLIDAGGVIRKRVSGAIDEKALNAEIDKRLGEAEKQAAK